GPAAEYMAVFGRVIGTRQALEQGVELLQPGAGMLAVVGAQQALQFGQGGLTQRVERLLLPLLLALAAGQVAAQQPEPPEQQRAEQQQCPPAGRRRPPGPGGRCDARQPVFKRVAGSLRACGLLWFYRSGSTTSVPLLSV